MAAIGLNSLTNFLFPSSVGSGMPVELGMIELKMDESKIEKALQFCKERYREGSFFLLTYEQLPNQEIEVWIKVCRALLLDEQFRQVSHINAIFDIDFKQKIQEEIRDIIRVYDLNGRYPNKLNLIEKITSCNSSANCRFSWDADFIAYLCEEQKKVERTLHGLKCLAAWGQF
ncbi:MAG: hypothetical protein ACOYK9_00495 [Chlamydiia bacterium]